MKSVKKFLQQEAVFCLALFLGMISMFWVPPSLSYYNYINFNVLILLFCLMTVVAGIQHLGGFYFLGVKLLHKVRSKKILSLILIYLCFFSSMLITNDVALLTFVPFSIAVLKMINQENSLIWLIVLETIASNLGSMLTPWGNPQNLYLFALSGMNIGQFILFLAPLTMISFVLLTILIFSSNNIKIKLTSDFLMTENIKLNKKKILLYVFLFLLSLMAVAKLILPVITLLILLFTVLLWDRSVLKKIDYMLLLTFICFFIFTGNVKQIEGVNSWLNSVIYGHECLAGILLSQLISNVPAAMLLSGFTASYDDLLYGVNIGGLGTMIASMASLISYRYYVKEASSKRGKYILFFTFYNILFLVILFLIYYYYL